MISNIQEKKIKKQGKVLPMAKYYVLSVLVILFRHGLRGAGSEFLKTKRGFCQARDHSQNTLSFLKHVSCFGRFDWIFTTYFSRIKTLNDLLF